ncbi:MAG TPA: cysteine desulfurase family protein [Myxococcota bacterium]|nr:cysteine desulfurase family protein [Myxococcota bacterium]
MSCIYLDHHATTPMDPRVFAKMEPFFLSQFGNAASQSHPFGWAAEDAVDRARIEVASAINAHPSEIIFTSGATESINMAIKGLFLPVATVPGRHIVTSSIEHGATKEAINAVLAAGVSVTTVKPNSAGIVDEESVLSHVQSDTALVSLFMVQSEIGSINPIAKMGRALKKCGALFHCDAAQALGRLPIDCQELNVDMMSLSGHKAYGPKGIGVLYLRRGIFDRICPLMHGGGQEWHKRSGTLNVPGIVGMGEAARLAAHDFIEDDPRIRALRDRLMNNLFVLDGVHVNGTLKERVSGNLNVSFDGIDGEELILAICQQVAVSTGSACNSYGHGPSKVLEELGIPKELTQSSIRFGLGRFTTIEEIDYTSDLIIKHVTLQRQAR